MALNSPLIILCDTREQTPLRFPATLKLQGPNATSPRRTSLGTYTVKLKTGDYVLQGAERCGIVERKGSIREIATNVLTRDRRRFEAELARLRSECSHPILFFEGNLKSFLRPTSHVPDPQAALDTLWHLLLQYRCQMLCLPLTTPDDKIVAGEMVARLLIAAASQTPLPPLNPPPTLPTAV